MDAMGFNHTSELISASRRFGFAVIGISSPNHTWTWSGPIGNSAGTYQRCKHSDSLDIKYADQVIKWAKDEFSVDSVYLEGFGLDSAFAAYIGFCSGPNKIAGVYQAGFGLAQTNRTAPGNASELYRSLGQGSIMYEPIYPCYTSGRPMVDCLMVYENDAAVESVDDMYQALAREGHDARKGKFPKAASGDGHQSPHNRFDWLVSCLGIADQCSAVCASALALCVKGKKGAGTSSHEAYAECITKDTVDSLKCTPGCAPTLGMVNMSEAPSLTLSRGLWGSSNKTLSLLQNMQDSRAVFGQQALPSFSEMAAQSLNNANSGEQPAKTSATAATTTEDTTLNATGRPGTSICQWTPPGASDDVFDYWNISGTMFTGNGTVEGGASTKTPFWGRPFCCFLFILVWSLGAAPPH